MASILNRLFLLTALVLTARDLSAAELYNLDFASPENGNYQTVFGTPTVQSSVGPFQDTLVFNAVSTYEQIRFPISTGSTVPGYKVECDIFTHNLLESSYGFTIFLDTPQVRPVSFSGSDNAFYSTYHGIDLSDDVAFHVEIIADFQANRMTITFDDQHTLIKPLNASLVSSVRFSLAPAIGGVGDAPGTYVALDNIRISTIPEPPIWSLILTALVPACFWYHRKRPVLNTMAPSPRV